MKHTLKKKQYKTGSKGLIFQRAANTSHMTSSTFLLQNVASMLQQQRGIQARTFQNKCAAERLQISWNLQI